MIFRICIDVGNNRKWQHKLLLVFQKPKITIIFPNNLNLNSKTYNILLPAACNGINEKDLRNLQDYFYQKISKKWFLKHKVVVHKVIFFYKYCASKALLVCCKIWGESFH